MLKFVTFNIRCVMNSTFDGKNDFLHRAGLILDTIDKKQPDIICFQEVTEAIYKFLKKHITDYALIWRGRNEDLLGEGLLLMIKRNAVELLDTDVFWLSDTPDIPGSRYEEQSMCPRICVVSVLRIVESDEIVRVYNTHLDRKEEYARNHGIKLILDRIKKDHSRTPMPIILAGDFNAFPSDEAIKTCDDFFEPVLKDLTSAFDITFHNFGKILADYKIDYIFVDSDTAEKVTDTFLWKENINGIYLSDHYPIETDIEI